MQGPVRGSAPGTAYDADRGVDPRQRVHHRRQRPRCPAEPLPALLPGAAGAGKQALPGLPRIYGLARELVSHAGLRLDRENIIAFVEAYQSVRALTIAELWAIPQMLRIALIEGIQDLAARRLTELRDREIADFWANRLITANRRDPNHLFAIMAELAENQPSPSPYFAFQLIDHLYDEEAALVPVQSWLERIYRTPLSELSSREQNRQTKDQLSIGNAFTSLRQLALLDWRQIFEQVSRVERSLRLDPSGDLSRRWISPTRDRYRRAVEEIARRSGQAEEKVAQAAVELAARAARKAAEDDAVDPRRDLADRRRKAASSRGSCDCREAPRFRVLHWAYRHHSAVYFLGLGFLSALFISLIVLLGLREQARRNPHPHRPPFTDPRQPARARGDELPGHAATSRREPSQRWISRIRAFPTPSGRWSSCPCCCGTRQTIGAEVEKLEIRYLANKEANLLFSLFTDYTDSDRGHPVRTTDACSRPRFREPRSPQRTVRRRAFLPFPSGAERGANPSRNSSDGSANGGSWKSSTA